MVTKTVLAAHLPSLERSASFVNQGLFLLPSPLEDACVKCFATNHRKLMYTAGKQKCRHLYCVCRLAIVLRCCRGLYDKKERVFTFFRQLLGGGNLCISFHSRVKTEAASDLKTFSSWPKLLFKHLTASGSGQFNLHIIMQRKLFGVDTLKLHKAY